MKSWLKRLIYGKWRVVRTGWPYPAGFGVYNKRRMILSDSGLRSREQAVAIAERMNRYED